MTIYIITPLLAYLINGVLKFLINIIKNKKISAKYIGMGGMPSTHSAIASAPIALLIIIEGYNNPVVGLGISFLLIVIIDALDLRKKISAQAKEINKLNSSNKQYIPLKDNIYHNIYEVVGGIIVGMIVAIIIYKFKKYF